MTLRVKLEIVPFGVENNSYEIYHVDISNTGLIRNLGFGHEICSYKYSVMKPIPPVIQKPNGKQYEAEIEGEIEEHDRRDGSFSLIQKVLNNMEEKGYI